MKFPNFFYPKYSTNLFGLKENFNFLNSLYLKKKLPNVLLLSGKKGSGKSTLVNHFLFSIFDSGHYDNEKFTLSKKSNFFNQFINDIFPNIIYLKGSDFKSVKIDDIRSLKKKIFNSSILNRDRFIILDDVELFSLNTVNALLKIIEEPTQKNFFFLINNKARPLLETLKSRALEVNIFLNNDQRIDIIKNITDLYKIELILDPINSQLTPGNFIVFNHICDEYNISLKSNYIDNLSLLLSLYKKDKLYHYIDLIFFITNSFLMHLKEKKVLKNDKIYEIKNHIFHNLNNFLIYNINQNNLVNSINRKLNHG